MNEILVALITGGSAVLGTIISNKATENRINQQIIVQQAVTDTKLEELTREVREHNNFAKRMPAVEKEIEHIGKDIQRLEGYHSE